ncbi:helix-turn-helix transcriptional regulator [Gorillibacterium massiliense]|uniref:helix-turn-helix transcriptional regulator n=1 Tax=Gorillibacterium massiliense TaxID=1280390 RepID=UPI0004ACD829|nr:helix-turn-helix transcriptional regulator [Gorillibacterium massiliense]
MERYGYITKVTEFIEKSYGEEIDLEMAAKAGSVSLMQLYRDFYVCTGHSLKEYIRKKRLSNACAMLKHTNVSLVEVALTHGYKTQQAFHKHFKSVLGVTPLEYRHNELHFGFYPTINELVSFPVKVAAEIIPRVIRVSYDDLREEGIENRAIAKLRALLGDKSDDGDWPGRMRLFGRNGKPETAGYRYELMLAPLSEMTECLDRLRGSDFLEVSVMEEVAAVFASVTVDNREDRIERGWNYLYNHWLSFSMFMLDDGDYLEEFILRGMKIPKLRLLLPVKKKPSYRTVVLRETPAMTFLVSKKSGPGAEKDAAETVMGYISACAPWLKDAAVFYVAVSGVDGYTCGVMMEEQTGLPHSQEVEIVRHPAGIYASISDNCWGDIRMHAKHLDSWLKLNGFYREDQMLFALYESRDASLDESRIRMTLYAPVNLLKRDNTAGAHFDIVGDKGE